MQQLCVSVIKELNTKGLLLDLQVSIIENMEDSSQVFHVENHSIWSTIFSLTTLQFAYKTCAYLF